MGDELKLQEIIVSPDAPVRHALAIIDQFRGAACLVVDDTNRLLGTVSDGDIRRAMLKGQDLETPVSRIMFNNPITARSDTPNDELLAIMRAREIRDLPLIDGDGRLVKMRTMRELLEANVRDNWVVLMAGGRGKRLMPLTDQTPKPMLMIDDRPILESILVRLINQGFRNFYISVNYLAHIIKLHFEDGRKFGVNIRYLEEDAPLGTGGALSLIKETHDLPLILTNGDVLTALDFGRMIDFHESEKPSMVVGVRDHKIQLPYGVFTTQDKQISTFEEKPIVSYLINTAIYTIDPVAFRHIKKNSAFDMPDLVMKCLASSEKVTPFHITDSWLDIGDHAELERARRDSSLLL